MIREWAVIVALGAALGTAGAADNDDDQKKIQGTWLLELVQSGPITSKPPKDKETTYTFDKGNLTMADKGQSPKKGTFKIDSSKTVKEIDLKWEKQAEATQAVYELKDDTLKLAFPTLGNKRPTALDPKEITVFTLKRKK